jgi:hypothetical protein
MWIAASFALVLAAQEDPFAAPLPPLPPWSGASRALIAAGADPWITPAERSGFATTPSYAETVEWLERLCRSAPQLRLVSIGTSHEGRPIPMVIASESGASDAVGLAANGNPTLLVQAGIHAGEIDGKDGGLMLLRDLTVAGKIGDLLAEVNLLFVPMLNPDGHEHVLERGRINQRGPANAGWRTNARNLNLNRDYAKLDTPECRAVVELLVRYDPELYLDLHVTDGIDYQYDVTYGFTGPHGQSPRSAAWLGDVFVPTCDAALSAAGHVPGPLIFPDDDTDPTKGLVDWTASPRFSSSYGDARHTPTVLVENHSLKGYEQRVLGTRVLLEAALRALAGGFAELRLAQEADRAERPERVTLSWGPGTRTPLAYRGMAFTAEPSAISGGTRIVWSGEPLDQQVEIVRHDAPQSSAARPLAYWVPPAYPEVIERLRLHGIRMERINGPRTLEVELLRLADPVLASEPFEGRVTVTAVATPERATRTFPPGSVRVPTDQPLGDLAVMLLEPDAPDSFFQWGFFLACLQRTEYVEGYVMEPLAERMLANDPELAAEFEAALAADAELAADPQARLEWLYRRSPWHDAEYGLYPVARELP